MNKEQMEQQFLARYDSITQSGDTRQMEQLGAMVKRVMGWMFKYEPQVAAQALALLDEDTSTDYVNWLTEQEAEDIVSHMKPQPTWTTQGLTSSLQSMGLPADVPPHFNHYALLTTMLMIQSDEGESLKEAIHANDRDERLLRLVYKLAVNRLEDEDGKFRIRRYFGLER
jgi:hypothetical protein